MSFEYLENEDMLPRLDSRVVQLEMAIRVWAANPTKENGVVLKKCFLDPAFNPITRLIEASKKQYRTPNFKELCFCGKEPNVADDVGPNEDMYAAGCAGCGVGPVSAFPTEEEAIEYFNAHHRYVFKGIEPLKIMDEADIVVSGENKVCTCIGCGCDDNHACFDEESGDACHWERVDREAGLGVCSSCPDQVGAWDNGDREMKTGV